MILCLLVFERGINLSQKRLMSRTNNIFVTPLSGTGSNHHDGDNINLLASDPPWAPGQFGAPPDHGSPLEGLSSLLSDVKLEKQFSSTGPSKGPPGIGVCDVRSVTKARPVFI